MSSLNLFCVALTLFILSYILLQSSLAAMQSIDNNTPAVDPPPPRRSNNHSTTQPTRDRPACAACKHQRKKCDENCIFAPHFPSTSSENFKKVHKVFGVSNIAKMMTEVPEDCRHSVAKSLVWEAAEREANPIEGCYAKFNQTEKDNKLLKQENKLLQLQCENMQLHKYCRCTVCANSHNGANDRDYYGGDFDFGNNKGDLYGNFEKEIIAGSISRGGAHSSNRVANFGAGNGVPLQFLNRESNSTGNHIGNGGAPQFLNQGANGIGLQQLIGRTNGDQSNSTNPWFERGAYGEEYVGGHNVPPSYLR